MATLLEIYQKLYHAFGPQHWWPGNTPFEIAIGAILTQNTNWGNVEKAIQNLKKQNSLSVKVIHEMPLKKLVELIRPAGYFNVKAKRIKSFINFLMNDCYGSMKKMKGEDTYPLREKLLSVHGVGHETADSILLYALEKPVFVIDAYTKRVLARHGIMEHERSYDEFQELFYSSMKKDVRLFNEYHALFVKVGKTFCKRKKPLCDKCPLKILYEDRTLRHSCGSRNPDAVPAKVGNQKKTGFSPRRVAKVTLFHGNRHEPMAHKGA